MIGISYTVEYDLSFVLLWGLLLSGALISGGLLFFAAMLTMMGILISHEYAHIKECEKRYIKINWVRFSLMGGAIDADVWYANDIVPIWQAGISNTNVYTFAFGGVYILAELLQCSNHMLAFARTILVGAAILALTNYAIPNVSDGAIVRRFTELRDELWNDGARIAEMYRKE